MYYVRILFFAEMGFLIVWARGGWRTGGLSDIFGNFQRCVMRLESIKKETTRFETPQNGNLTQSTNDARGSRPENFPFWLGKTVLWLVGMRNFWLLRLGGCLMISRETWNHCQQRETNFFAHVQLKSDFKRLKQVTIRPISIPPDAHPQLCILLDLIIYYLR